MPSPKVAVIPYIVGETLHVAVEVDGVEVFEGEQPLALLFKHLSECIDPNRADHEAEAYATIFCLEDGVRTINNILGERDE